MDTDTEASSITTMKQFTAGDKIYTLKEKGMELRDMILKYWKHGKRKSLNDISLDIGNLTNNAAKHCRAVMNQAPFHSKLDNLIYIMTKLVGRVTCEFFDVKTVARKLPGNRPQSDVDILVKFFKDYPSENVRLKQITIQSLATGLGVTYDRANAAVRKGWGRPGRSRHANQKVEHALKYLGPRVREDAPSATEELTAMSADMSALTITDEGGSSTGMTAQQQTETSVPTDSNLAKRNSDGTTTQPVKDHWEDLSDAGDA
jgi:hypothetical protein